MLTNTPALPWPWALPRITHSLHTCTHFGTLLHSEPAVSCAWVKQSICVYFCSCSPPSSELRGFPASGEVQAWRGLKQCEAVCKAPTKPSWHLSQNELRLGTPPPGEGDGVKHRDNRGEGATERKRKTRHGEEAEASRPGFGVPATPRLKLPSTAVIHTTNRA
ncbi:hypothetical protein FQA47_017004 [Oryzias melastigma]|uniref:Uncharacterized protein n=1 Tax=Oryzias melastigma TaxID=30732 RepID=A0A834F2V6_ORYME|nr:hypothetical protein FQA47_017004 [Oryzias melastigma]